MNFYINILLNLRNCLLIQFELNDVFYILYIDIPNNIMCIILYYYFNNIIILTANVAQLSKASYTQAVGCIFDPRPDN